MKKSGIISAFVAFPPTFKWRKGKLFIFASFPFQWMTCFRQQPISRV